MKQAILGHSIYGQQMSFFAKGQKVLVKSNVDKTDIIRANRLRLREILSHNIDVQWNKRVSECHITEAGGFRVTFSDGSFCSGDILVGADGINSSGVLFSGSFIQPPFPALAYKTKS